MYIRVLQMTKTITEKRLHRYDHACDEEGSGTHIEKSTWCGNTRKEKGKFDVGKCMQRRNDDCLAVGERRN